MRTPTRDVALRLSGAFLAPAIPTLPHATCQGRHRPPWGAPTPAATQVILLMLEPGPYTARLELCAACAAALPGAGSRAACPLARRAIG